jgi:transposase InsO family protein
MPWKERSVMSIRRELVLKALAKEATVAELCRRYEVSRKTAYKWIRRFQERGVDGLVDEPRRPEHSPKELSAQATLDIVRLRQQHPTWGPRKLQRLLARAAVDVEAVPSERTIARVLERTQMPRRRRTRRPPCYGRPLVAPHVTVEQPNDLWTVDFKGWWRTGDGKRFEPLTVRDAASRFVLALRVLERNSGDPVRQVFEELFERYGLPRAIQTDNGQPFACTQTLAGLTRLSAWWVSLGIELVRSRPGCPQDNGGHERMHVDVRFELEDHAAASLAEQQAACDGWRAEFNHVRPHEALQLHTPSEVYRPSTRRLHHVVDGGYPEGCYLMRLDGDGKVHYQGCRVYVSVALGGQQVGLKAHGEQVRIWFHHVLLGQFTPSECRGRRVAAIPVDQTDVLPQEGLQMLLPGVTDPGACASAGEAPGAPR